MVTFRVLCGAGPYNTGGSTAPHNMRMPTRGYPTDRGLYASEGASWLDGVVDWAINHQRVSSETERLVGQNLSPEPWLSPFMSQVPPPLRAQLGLAAEVVAPTRAGLLHPDLLDGRPYMGHAVDYLTPVDVRAILVHQFVDQGVRAARGRFYALRFDLYDPSGWSGTCCFLSRQLQN